MKKQDLRAELTELADRIAREREEGQSFLTNDRDKWRANAAGWRKQLRRSQAENEDLRAYATEAYEHGFYEGHCAGWDAGYQGARQYVQAMLDDAMAHFDDMQEPV